MKKISIVIPTFNETGNVDTVFDRVAKVFETSLADFDYDIWFLDNHSQDSTYDEILTLAAREDRVRGVRYVRNFGFQRSLMTGYRLVDGDAIVQLDCDLQDPPELIPEMVAHWSKGHDLVFGVREKRPEGFVQAFLRRSFYRTLARISSDFVPENAGDFRLTDRSLIEKLRRVNDLDPYVRGLISSMSRNPTGISYERARRAHGRSKFPFFRQMGFALSGIASHSVLPLRIASLFGAVVLVFTVGLMAFYLVGAVFGDLDWPAGLMTMLLLLLLSISFNCFFFGIIGEYLAHIHQNTRARPLAIIEKTVNVGGDIDTLERETWSGAATTKNALDRLG